jgi:hypothetical protein
LEVYGFWSLALAVADLIFERVSQVHREDGLAILLVEQRAAEALELADRATCWRPGGSCWRGRMTGCSLMIAFDARISGWACRTPFDPAHAFA